MEDSPAYSLPQRRCPDCQVLLDAATDCIGGEQRRPQRGDFTVCLYCAAVLRFAPGEDLVRASREDLELLRRSQPKTFFLLMGTVAATMLAIREQEFDKKREQALRN